jgi:hypothetical protein
MPQCKTCQKEFQITDIDRQFYHKIDIPEPINCQVCSDMIRMSWRNDRFLYPRECGLTGRKIISIISPEAGYQVLSNEAWYGDGWDGLNYGRVYEFNRGFFEQLAALNKAVPRLYAFAINNVNSEYCNGAQQDKDCYLLFVSDHDEDCYYVYGVFFCKDCVDSLNLNKCELCYECIDSVDCYHCFYGYNIRNCRDVYCSYDCSGCSDCFGCYNLRNVKYCWENKQLSENEYLKKISQIDWGSRQQSQEIERQFKEVIKNAVHQYAFLQKCTESTGDFLKNCKRSLNCYESYDLIDCYNVQIGVDSQWCRDCYVAVDKAELCSNCVSVIASYNCHFCVSCWSNRDCQYCDTCTSCTDCFACVGLKHKNFCIFNKQYSEEEYKKLREKIIEVAKSRGEYGQFLPPRYSPFAYNETISFDLYPLTKEEVLRRGWRWQDNLPGTFSQGTIKEIPDQIKGVKDEITKEILTCEQCGRNYKIVPRELAFYRKQNLPLPSWCWDCRHLKRWQMRNPRQLHHRTCQCEIEKHGHSQRCSNEFETTYNPSRPEKIYCEECYQKEIY